MFRSAKVFHRFSRLPATLSTGLLAGLLSFSAAHAQKPEAPQGPMINGYLCCNLRAEGKKISDINYDDPGKRMLAVGTPARITVYDRRWFEIEVNGATQRVMNDYSRDLNMTAFATRYVVTEDPRVKIATFPEKIRQAIARAKVMRGMTREQVLMALGYPVTSETPSLDSDVWNYWLDSFTAFRVEFDENHLVREVLAEPQVVRRVVAAP